MFLVTANDKDENYYERELQQGKNAIDAAKEASIQHFILSTLINCTKGQSLPARIVSLSIACTKSSGLHHLSPASCCPLRPMHDVVKSEQEMSDKESPEYSDKRKTLRH